MLNKSLMILGVLVGIHAGQAGQPAGPIDHTHGPQKVKLPGAIPVPILPAGVSQAFSERYYAAADAIVEHRFEDAKAMLRFLPHRGMAYSFSVKGLDTDMRFALSGKLPTCIATFNSAADANLRPAQSSASADLLISFEPSLGKDPITGQAKTVAIVYHDEPKAAPVEIVLSIRRDHGKTVTVDDFQSDLNYGLITYLGVARLEMAGALSNHNGFGSSKVVAVASDEANAISGALNAVANLTALIPPAGKESKDTFVAGRPDLFLEPRKVVSGGPVTQGEPFQFQIQVTNRGTSFLRTKLIPDCNCFSFDRVKTVPAGDTQLYSVTVDTHQYSGSFHKVLFLLSNDPLHPFLKIPVNIDIQPRYRTFMPDGDQIVVETDEATTAIYLIPQGKPLTVTSTVLDGIPGEADFSAWSGRLPNQTADVQGYKITVRVPENIPDGAHYVNLKIATDEPGLKSVSIPLLVQRGIACTPERIIWGTLTFPVDSQVELSNPKRAFKILKIRTSNPHFKARVTDSGLAKTHRLKVHYDGAGAAGPVSGWVFVTTNDPHRPTVKLPFEGQVQ